MATKTAPTNTATDTATMLARRRGTPRELTIEEEKLHAAIVCHEVLARVQARIAAKAKP